MCSVDKFSPKKYKNKIQVFNGRWCPENTVFVKSSKRLQQFLHLGREGRIYARQPGEQETHFGCLNLLINMVIVWNTVYMAEAVYDIQSDSIEINDNDLKHLSPARRAHINPYGKYLFNKNGVLPGTLRPLRSKKK